MVKYQLLTSSDQESRRSFYMHTLHLDLHSHTQVSTWESRHDSFCPPYFTSHLARLHSCVCVYVEVKVT